MKFTLPNGVTIFVREEDFIEAHIGNELFRYKRPNGTQVSVTYEATFPVQNTQSLTGDNIPEALKKTLQPGELSEPKGAGNNHSWRRAAAERKGVVQSEVLTTLADFEKRFDELKNSLKPEPSNELKTTQEGLVNLKATYEEDHLKINRDTQDLFQQLRRIEEDFAEKTRSWSVERTELVQNKTEEFDVWKKRAEKDLGHLKRQTDYLYGNLERWKVVFIDAIKNLDKGTPLTEGWPPRTVKPNTNKDPDIGNSN